MDRRGVTDCLALSDAAYGSSQAAVGHALAIGATFLHAFHVKDVHCYCFAKDNVLYFATRGTDIMSVCNLIKDVRILPEYHSETGLVHRGFLHWAELIWKNVLEVLHSEGSQYDKVVFTGHSAGGAASYILAVKASGYLASIGGSKPYVVTFGSPMVGTICFSRIVSRCTHHFRVTNNNDPVPHVPLWPLYCHASGVRYHIMADGKVVKNPSLVSLLRDVPHGVFYFALNFAKEYAKTQSFLWAAVKSLKTGDHFIVNYRRYFK